MSDPFFDTNILVDWLKDRPQAAEELSRYRRHRISRIVWTEVLAGEGIEAEVLDLRTLRPLDREAVLTSLAKTNRMVVAEEGWPQCSIASEVMAICMEDGFDHLDAPVLRVCDEDVPLPYAANLEKAAIIDADRIAAAARKVCYR